ncbi:MAG TPA: epoxide hydrolase [Vicinamibacterales bacterium]|nr:epoxide hydrolase [Vicinamibacterales bacterium]
MRRIWTLVAIFLLMARGAAVPHAADDLSVVPFRIHVADADLADLKARLARARLPDEIRGSGWTYGTSRAYLESLVRYWRDGFDWRAQERALNRFEQFTTTIDGLKIHFIHRRSKERNALPLLITHGWPGSIVEFTKVIDPLSEPAAHGGRAEDAFDIVAPSLPGFGFSDKPRDRGFDPTRIAAIEAALMARLGYSRYGVQGGDWGSIISTRIALNDAPHVAGLHLNMCRTGPPPGANPNEGLTTAEVERLKRADAWQTEETGYQRIQGTKPQTIGYALNDSPVGLAAWIVEKFRAWCDCDGDPEKIFTKDELLTNITLYWVTQTATSSARIYYESAHAAPLPASRRIEPPTACADFPKEVIWSPRKWMEARYNIARWTEMPRGGHFAAFEQPALFVDDVREFFRGLRTAAVH